MQTRTLEELIKWWFWIVQVIVNIVLECTIIVSNMLAKESVGNWCCVDVTVCHMYSTLFM